MKNLIYLFVLSIFMISCNKEHKTDYVLLSGKIENSDAKEINISGYKFKKAIPVNEDGSFNDTLYLTEKGYYSLRAKEYTTMFLENGYVLNLTVNAKEFDESIAYTGNGAEVNNYMAAKYLMEEKLKPNAPELYALNENDYKSKIGAIRSALDSLLAAANADNYFKEMEKENIFYAYGSALLRYPSGHRYYAKKEAFEPSENFYDDIKDINYRDESAYASIPAYRDVAGSKFGDDYNENYKKHNNSTSQAFIATLKDFPRGYMKDELMNNYVRFSLTTDEHMEAVYNAFMSEVQNEEYKTQVEKKYEKIKNLVKGKPSPVFTYENHKGGKTSLEDLKGKYVYIDVWATWCGPCKAEIPSLKQLEKDYHNSNIEFVSISIDTPKAYETWKKMVVDEELGGIQLIADNNWKSKFVTDYGIEGIPRFILIDPEGNIINSNAPRPSNEKLRSLFSELKI